jgi:hypothetical protein
MHPCLVHTYMQCSLHTCVYVRVYPLRLLRTLVYILSQADPPLHCFPTHSRPCVYSPLICSFKDVARLALVNLVKKSREAGANQSKFSFDEISAFVDEVGVCRACSVCSVCGACVLIVCSVYI